MIEDLIQFYGKMGWPIPGEPVELSDQRRDQRIGHMREELHEFIGAKTAADQADALIDFCYVALGTFVEAGQSHGPVAVDPTTDQMELIDDDQAFFVYVILDEYVDEFSKTSDFGCLRSAVAKAVTAAQSHGLRWHTAWDRVHAANMAKEPGSSNRHGAREAVKPEGWTAPDFSDLCEG